jgi:hypothetical protein
VSQSARPPPRGHRRVGPHSSSREVASARNVGFGTYSPFVRLVKN